MDRFESGLSASVDYPTSEDEPASGLPHPLSFQVEMEGRLALAEEEEDKSRLSEVWSSLS